MYAQREELSREERKSVELEEYLKELVQMLNKKFDEQRASTEEIKKRTEETKDDMLILHREIGDLRSHLNSMNETLMVIDEKQKKLTRNVLGALLD